MENRLSYHVGFGIIDFVDFSSFVEEVNDDFIPSLLDRINVRDYFDKLRNNAVFVVCRNGSDVVGLQAFYCNDVKKRIGFTTFLAVKREYRGGGIAKILLEISFIYSKACGMERVGISTSNELAYGLYLKIGFVKKDMSVLPQLKINHYYLERDL